MPAATLNAAHDNLSPSDLGDPATTATHPISRSGDTHHVEDHSTSLTSQKKKKKKPKKSAKAKEAAATAAAKVQCPTDPGRPSVLCISRNKHWRYISSYHVRLVFFPISILIMFL